MIDTVNDVNNLFLSRREITCNFRGLAGKLKKSEAVNMITKEFKLDGKTVIAINLKHHTGRPNILGTFYIYDDENMAKKQVNPTIFERIDKQKKKDEENYKHRGIASRSFQRQWQMGADVEVKEVTFQDGLLTVTLEKYIPEAQKKKLWFGKELKKLDSSAS